MAKRVNLETDRHAAALRYYLGLGPGRKIVEVARKFGVSSAAVHTWATSYDWRRRAADHDASVGRRTREVAASEVVEQGVQSNALNRQILQLAKAKLAKAVVDGNLRMNLGDIERLFRMEDQLAQADSAARAGDSPDGDTLDHLSLPELWQLIRAEVDAVNRLATHCEEVRRLERSGEIVPLPRLVVPAETGAE